MLACTGQSEYQRGVSAWNFDVEDLKAQASLVRYILLCGNQDISCEDGNLSLLFVC